MTFPIPGLARVGPTRRSHFGRTGQEFPWRAVMERIRTKKAASITEQGSRLKTEPPGRSITTPQQNNASHAIQPSAGMQR